MELSRLTTPEYVGLKATLHAIDHKRFQCDHCPERNRKAMGCTTIDSVKSIVKDIEFRTCPGNFWETWALMLLSAHTQNRQGVLPFDGAMMDQPAKIVEAFSVIDEHISDKMEADAKKQKAQQRHRR